MNNAIEIRLQVNLLIKEQTKQQETLVHISSILTSHDYTTQVKRQKLNEVMDALQKAHEDMNILFNIKDILLHCLRYHQIYTYANTILTYLRDCLIYMRQVTTHRVDYVDAAMTNILSPDTLPVGELGTMLRHLEVQLLSIMDLPISSDNTLHFTDITSHMFW